MNKLKYWYLKFRNRLSFRGSKGFGVHSPFVFNLITGVLKDKSKYYAFDQFFEQKLLYSKKELKYSKLIFRLANHLKIKSIYCNDSCYNKELGVLSKLHSNIFINNCLTKKTCSDFLLLGLEDYSLYVSSKSSLFSLFKENEVTIVIKDMYKYDNLFKMWKDIKEESIVSIDLFDIGILFFNKKLQEGNYVAHI